MAEWYSISNANNGITRVLFELSYNTVFGIYRYDTGIWPFFDSFWTGMVYWYANQWYGASLISYRCVALNMSPKPLWSPSHESLPTRQVLYGPS